MGKKPTTIDPETSVYYDTVGRLLTAWAELEFNLDISMAAFHNWGGHGRYGKRPMVLGVKIAALRAAFAREPQLAQLVEPLNRLCDEIEADLDVRHDIVHGLPTARNPETGAYGLVRLQLHPRRHWTQRRVEYTIEDLRASAIRIYELGAKLHQFPKALLTSYESMVANGMIAPEDRIGL